MKRWRVTVYGVTTWETTVEVEGYGPNTAANRALAEVHQMLADDPPSAAPWQTDVSHDVEADDVKRVDEV